MWLDGIDEQTSEKRAGQLIETSKSMVSMSGDDDHPLGISVGVAFLILGLANSWISFWLDLTQRCIL